MLWFNKRCLVDCSMVMQGRLVSVGGMISGPKQQELGYRKVRVECDSKVLIVSLSKPENERHHLVMWRLCIHPEKKMLVLIGLTNYNINLLLLYAFSTHPKMISILLLVDPVCCFFLVLFLFGFMPP